uniref:Glycine-rich domain-containing protein-like n=1 Tax=Brassica oleracea var. oleracea TaxID=109376 RepID=A0A0D3CP51_BRAOL
MKFSQLTGMKKEIVQNLEWLEAQKIEISIDLIAESKKHLQFLGVVDCNQLLYDGPALKRAIYRANVDSEIIMEEAVGRYKAFLYLIKENREKTIRLISVPTYDIDLIWHTHQLNPSSYYKDMVKIFGNILQHDDTADSATSEGMNLDTVFSGTTAQWEETFGQRYWKASMDTTPHTSAMVETERSGAGARCLAEAAEKCSAGARCFAVEAEKTSARCFAVDAEKKNARCFALEAEKNSARCFALEAEKNSVRCFSVEAEKKNATCFAVEAEKNSARCFAVEAEKNSARCFAVGAEKNRGCGCGNLMENNAQENAPLAEGATAA